MLWPGEPPTRATFAVGLHDDEWYISNTIPLEISDSRDSVRTVVSNGLECSEWIHVRTNLHKGIL